MPLLPGLPTRAFPCGRGVSDHRHRHLHHHHAADDPRDGAGIQSARQVQRMQPDGAAGTECLSRLDEDVVHRERADGDADDPAPTAAAELHSREERTESAPRAVPASESASVAAPPEVPRARVLRPSAPASSRVFLRQELELQSQQVSRRELQQRGDAGSPAHPAHSHLRPQASRAQRQEELPRQHDDVVAPIHRLLRVPEQQVVARLQQLRAFCARARPPER